MALVRSPEALARLLAEIRRCRVCRELPVGTPLAHEPRPVLQAAATARIALCGQAPGTRVHRSGRPFDDASGERLRDWLGIDAPTFYDARHIAIIPMGFCFPGQDRKGADLPPRRECAPLWHDALFAQLPYLRLMVLIGSHAQHWHLGGRAGSSLTATVANWRQISTCGAEPAMLPLPHPSWRNNGWLRRNPWFEAELLPDLRKRIAILLTQEDDHPTGQPQGAAA